MKLQEIVPGAYFAKSTSLETLSPSGRVTWEWGFELVGMTSRGRFLSNGKPGNTCNGMELVPEWDEREGYVVLDYAEFAQMIFNKPEIPVVGIGVPSRGYWGGIVPTKIAVCEADIMVGNGPTSIDRGTFKSQATNFFEALLQHKFRCDFHAQSLTSSRPMVEFTPLQPLSRAVWFEMGYWITTKETETIDSVVRIETSAGIRVNAQSIEDVVAHGLSVPKPLCADQDHNCYLRFDSIRIDVPELAARIWPLAAYISPGTIVDTCPSLEHITLNSESLPNLKPLSERVCTNHVSRCSVGNAELMAPLSAIHLKGDAPVFGNCPTRGPVLFATPEFVESALIGSRSASARYVLSDDCTRYTVFVDGNTLSGYYYLSDQVKKCPSRVESRKAEAERKAALIARFGDNLPHDWIEYTDADFEDGERYKQKLAEGWLTSAELEHSMGIEGDRHLYEWLINNDFPRIKCRRNPTFLFKPVTLEEISTHDEFPKLFAAILGKNSPFAARCMFLDSARASILCHTMAS